MGTPPTHRHTYIILIVFSVVLLQVSLGEEAEDELHVVAVESKNMPSVFKPVPIASLQRSALPMVTPWDSEHRAEAMFSEAKKYWHHQPAKPYLRSSFGLIYPTLLYIVTIPLLVRNV